MKYKVVDTNDWEEGKEGIKLVSSSGEKLFIPYSGKGWIPYPSWYNFKDSFFYHAREVADELMRLRILYDLRVYGLAYYRVRMKNGEWGEFSTPYTSHIDIPYNNYQFHPFDKARYKPLDKKVAREVRELYLKARLRETPML